MIKRVEIIDQSKEIIKQVGFIFKPYFIIE